MQVILKIALPIFVAISLFAKILGEQISEIGLMDNETISIHIDKFKKVKVSVKFLFIGNLGPKILFPETEYFQLKSFSVIWNNTVLKTKAIQPLTGFQFMINKDIYPRLFESIIPKNQNTKHEVTVNYFYHSPHWNKSNKSDLPSGHYFEYILRTGQTWKNKINRIKVNIKLPVSNCDRIHYFQDSYILNCESGILTNELSDIEPEKNIKFILADPEPTNITSPNTG